MKCSTVKKYLTREWEPSAEISAVLREHLDSCPACHAVYQAMVETFEMLELPEVLPGSEFSTAWRSRIREEAAKTVISPAKNRNQLVWLKPVYAFGLLAVIGLGWLGYHYHINRSQTGIPEIAALKALPKVEQSVALKSLTPPVSSLYELKVVEVGPKSKEVQRVIRNFRGSHEEGIVFSNKEENEEWTTFKELSFQSADDLRTELEKLGAKVKVHEMNDQ